MAEFRLMEHEKDGARLFGIAVQENGNAIASYPEISHSKEEAERLLRRMEGTDLSPVHYDDVVRNYLFELMYERMERNGV